MFLSWFSAENAKAFGLDLARFYIDRVQTEQRNKGQKFIEKKQRELLRKISMKIEQFRKNNALNFYQKAQAVNKFKWCLLDAGFDKEYVDELSSWIVRQL